MPDIYIKVGIIIENEEGKILLIKEKVDENSPLAWNMIKGSYEMSDGKIEDCAKRECMEEAGMEVEILGVHNIMFFHKKDKLKIQCNFIAKPLGNNVSLPSDRNVSIEGENIQKVQWMSPDEIKQLKVDDFVADYTLGVVTGWLETRKLCPLNILEYMGI